MARYDRIFRRSIDLNGILNRVLQNHSKDIEELNKSQLLKGIRSDGSTLPPYTYKYAKKKGRPILPKILKDTGDFHDGIFTTFFDKSFTLQSSDWKGEILSDQWGSKIYGLTDESKGKIIQEYKDELIREFKKSLSNVS